MTTPAPGSNPARLCELIQRHVDGVLTDTEAAELNAALLASPAPGTPEATALLAAAMRLDAAITRTHRSDTTAPSTKPDAERKRGVGISSGSAPTLSAAGAPIYRKGCEPKTKSAIGNRQSAILWSLAAALLAACGVAVYLLAFNTAPQPDPIRPNQPGPSVATLIEVSGGGDLRTPHGYPAEGEDFSAGEYTLTSGKAEFMLTNAVNVKLRGDTRMVMRNDMNVALTRGTAEFVCPTDAKGFTVQLPDGSKVVDLGTAFEVKLDSQGRARVRVTDGNVRVVGSRGTIEADAGTNILISDETEYTLWKSKPISIAVDSMPSENAESAILTSGRFEAAINAGRDAPTVEIAGIRFAGVTDRTTSDDRGVRISTDASRVGVVTNDQLRHANPWRSDIAPLFDSIDASHVAKKFTINTEGLAIGQRYRIQLLVGQPLGAGSKESSRNMHVRVGDHRTPSFRAIVDASGRLLAKSIVIDFIAEQDALSVELIAEPRARAVLAAATVFSIVSASPENQPHTIDSVTNPQPADTTVSPTSH